ncbi:hypothetical protein Pmar_PMAR023563 [Perkinsus marinus ATCC 50983]|uniref:Uncharacterized protein n=1 Tax=Perkinsus marinus (strain ATCC 50983 / TXsc) TaxID=423536 RepID=C5KCP3_PERM5|nr:hypothetical protein Pmar_PMAR023563 [Perkinsus marinus ATCC 50983]EER17642.1 hypothetical protein Pmar_PMAR023563 [Perkinsus marinus ATCC 50983]|eukprot:XP_002785846.1 hypothetical protein Pmar_PMAR023563 [Perkinsus marinus ATCC 50983]
MAPTTRKCSVVKPARSRPASEFALCSVPDFSHRYYTVCSWRAIRRKIKYGCVGSSVLLTFMTKYHICNMTYKRNVFRC